MMFFESLIDRRDIIKENNRLTIMELLKIYAPEEIARKYKYFRAGA